MKVSIITTCKGRLAHAKQSIPRFLAQEIDGSYSYDVIVVDFGCPDGIFDWYKHIISDKLHYIKAVHDTEYFHLARARNIGGLAAIELSNADILCFADIDHLLPSDWLQEYMVKMESEQLDLLNANFDKRVPRLWELEFFGLCCIRKECFLAMRGFDEAFTSWGFDDVDLYARIRRSINKYRYGHLSANIDLINHTEEESMRFHKIKTIKESGEINRKIMEDIDRIVNPGEWGQV